MTPATLDPAAESVLKTTFSRAMVRAGEALGEMSGHEIAVDAPDVRRCTAADVITLAGGPSAVVVGVYVGIMGSLSGHALLILPPDGARRLARILLDGISEPADVEAGDPLAFGDLELSALQEVGNVTISAFLNEIGRHLAEPVTPTVPQAVVEMAGAILDGVLMDLMMESDQILAARTTFREGDVKVDGALLILPRPAPLIVLLDALGIAAR